MFDLVPFAGSGRKVEDDDGHSQFVGQLLEFDLPKANAGAVASAAVGGDRQGMGAQIAGASHDDPPGAYRIHGEGGGVVVDPDADPSFVVGDIVNAVGRGATKLGVDEVVDADRLGRSGWPVFTSAIPKVADEFFLLRIDGDRRLVGCDGGLDRFGDVSELRVAVDVTRSFKRLSIALKRVAKRLQQRPDNVVADAMPHRAKRVGQVPQAFRRPLQRRHGIAPGGGINKPLQIAEKRRVRPR